jgi:hypothetical protein
MEQRALEKILPDVGGETTKVLVGGTLDVGGSAFHGD